MSAVLMQEPVYEIAPTDVAPPLTPADAHGDGDIRGDLCDACSVLDVCVSTQSQSLCDLVCEFQYRPLPSTLPSLDHLWEDDVMSSVDLSDSFTEFMNGGFDAEVATMVAVMEDNSPTPQSPAPEDPPSGEPDDLKDETYLPPVRSRPRVRRRSFNDQSQLIMFFKSVHQVERRFDTHLALQELQMLWHGRESFDAFLKVNPKYFNVTDGGYRLSKRAKRRLKLVV